MKQIVIGIPDDMIKSLEQGNFGAKYNIYDLVGYLMNGTPLPKGHGRLKDIDAFITKVKADRKHSAYLKSWTADDVLNALDNSYAPTIIEGSDSDADSD